MNNIQTARADRSVNYPQHSSRSNLDVCSAKFWGYPCATSSMTNCLAGTSIAAGAGIMFSPETALAQALTGLACVPITSRALEHSGAYQYFPLTVFSIDSFLKIVCLPCFQNPSDESLVVGDRRLMPKTCVMVGGILSASLVPSHKEIIAISMLATCVSSEFPLPYLLNKDTTQTTQSHDQVGQDQQQQVPDESPEQRRQNPLQGRQVLVKVSQV